MHIKNKTSPAALECHCSLENAGHSGANAMKNVFWIYVLPNIRLLREHELEIVVTIGYVGHSSNPKSNPTRSIFAYIAFVYFMVYLTGAR